MLQWHDKLKQMQHILKIEIANLFSMLLKTCHKIQSANI